MPDSDLRPLQVQKKPVKRFSSLGRTYHFEWQPKSPLAGLLGLLVFILMMTAAFMFSLMLIVAVALLILLFAGIAVWRGHRKGRE